MQPQELLNCTLSDLQFSRTYFPAELCSSHTSFPAWKYFVFVRRDILGAVKILNILSLRGRLNLIFKSSDGDLRAREGPKDLLHHGEMLHRAVCVKQHETLRTNKICLINLWFSQQVRFMIQTMASSKIMQPTLQTSQL